MIRFLKRFFWIIVAFFLLNIAVSIWVLRADLKSRYPNIDFSLARFGISSWYSKSDPGINHRTANNEVFNDRLFTCASWDYPFNQKLVVINTFSGKWVVCRVNDRGPAKHLNRQIDLTKAAFRRIANLKRGLIYVTIIPVD